MNLDVNKDGTISWSEGKNGVDNLAPDNVEEVVNEAPVVKLEASDEFPSAEDQAGLEETIQDLQKSEEVDHIIQNGPDVENVENITRDTIVGRPKISEELQKEIDQEPALHSESVEQVEEVDLDDDI